MGLWKSIVTFRIEVVVLSKLLNLEFSDVFGLHIWS